MKENRLLMKSQNLVFSFSQGIRDRIHQPMLVQCQGWTGPGFSDGCCICWATQKWMHSAMECGSADLPLSGGLPSLYKLLPLCLLPDIL